MMVVVVVVVVEMCIRRERLDCIYCCGDRRLLVCWLCVSEVLGRFVAGPAKDLAHKVWEASLSSSSSSFLRVWVQRENESARLCVCVLTGPD